MIEDEDEDDDERLALPIAARIIVDRKRNPGRRVPATITVDALSRSLS